MQRINDKLAQNETQLAEVQEVIAALSARATSTKDEL